jgi:hypothetical protein
MHKNSATDADVEIDVKAQQCGIGIVSLDYGSTVPTPISLVSFSASSSGDVRPRPPQIHPFGFWFLVFGFWFLVFGFWFLVFGFWFLVLVLSCGFWVLGVGFGYCSGYNPKFIPSY